MIKKVRQHIKQEKRIVRLMYRKGILGRCDLDKLYWESFYEGNRLYKNAIKLPSIYFDYIDYWGECWEKELKSTTLEYMYYDGFDSYDIEEAQIAGLESSFKVNTRSQFIKYLKALPTVRTDSKINQVLRINPY